MSESWLAIFPKDPRTEVPTAEKVEGVLKDIGLIGEPFDFNGTSYWKAGPDFEKWFDFPEGELQLALAQELNQQIDPPLPGISLKEQIRVRLQFLESSTYDVYRVEPKEIILPDGLILFDLYDILDSWYGDPDYKVRNPYTEIAYEPFELDFGRKVSWGKFSIIIHPFDERMVRPKQELLSDLESRLGYVYLYANQSEYP